MHNIIQSMFDIDEKLIHDEINQYVNTSTPFGRDISITVDSMKEFSSDPLSTSNYYRITVRIVGMRFCIIYDVNEIRRNLPPRCSSFQQAFEVSISELVDKIVNEITDNVLKAFSKS